MAGAGAVDTPTRKPCICRGSYAENYIEECGGTFRCGWGNDNCSYLMQIRREKGPLIIPNEHGSGAEI